MYTFIQLMTAKGNILKQSIRTSAMLKYYNLYNIMQQLKTYQMCVFHSNSFMYEWTILVRFLYWLSTMIAVSSIYQMFQ